MELTFDLNAAVTLPDTVSALMNDGTRRQVAATWEDCDLAAISAGGERDWSISGEADGMAASCVIHMVRYNYLRNGSFEEDDCSMWVATDLSACDELYAEEKKSDSMAGSRHWHFYSKAADSVRFTL